MALPEFANVEHAMPADEASISLIRTEHPPTQPRWSWVGYGWQRIARFPESWPLPSGDLFVTLTEADRSRLCTLSYFPAVVEPAPWHIDLFPRLARIAALWSRRRG